MTLRMPMTRPTAFLNVARSTNCPWTDSSLKINSTSVTPPSEIVHVLVELVEKALRPNIYVARTVQCGTQYLGIIRGTLPEKVNRDLFCADALGLD
jgi:hypothetical protein